MSRHRMPSRLLRSQLALISAGVALCLVASVATALVGMGPTAQSASVAAAQAALPSPSDPTILPLEQHASPSPSVTASPAPAARPGTAPAAATTNAVAPLANLVVPDLLVTGTKSFSTDELQALSKLTGVTVAMPVAVGAVQLPGGKVTALGVDPSTFREVTPHATGASDPLWASVARGEALVTYDTAKAQALALGATVPVGAPSGIQQVRLGSFADIRMAGIGTVVSGAAGTALGLTPNAGIVLAAPSRDAVGFQQQVAALVKADGATVTLLRPILPSTSGGGATMSKGLYQKAAATCPGMPWSVLAAIGGIESDHGADTGVSSAGAEGPMQFLPTTFGAYATDGDGDGKALIDDPADAAFTAAKMLCRNGA
ncbi:MAG TPA: lytic murein transglycosylase, partial [Frankiaceae bacterium]